MREAAVRKIRLDMLGRCGISIDGVQIDGVSAHFFRIAAFIILAGANAVVPRRTVWKVLWSDSDDKIAATNLRQALVRIHHVQEVHHFRLIETNFSSLYLNARHRIRCDLIELADCVRGSGLDSAAELAGGELLTDLGGSADGFEEWLTMQRENLHAYRSNRLKAAMAPGSGHSRGDRILCAQRLLAADPFNEETYLCLMQDAAERRQVGRLKSLYDRMSAILAEELGVRPALETTARYHEILRSLKD